MQRHTFLDGYKPNFDTMNRAFTNGDVLCVFDDLPEEEQGRMREHLRYNGYHQFESPSEAGADYCEITEQPGPCPEEE